MWQVDDLFSCGRAAFFFLWQGNDGKITTFGLNGVHGGDTYIPRAHTCFNRIDIPTFSSLAKTREVLSLIILADDAGFYGVD